MKTPIVNAALIAALVLPAGASAGALGGHAYPQVFEQANPKVNLCNSSMFRARNARFLRELDDSTRALRHAAGDSLDLTVDMRLWVGARGRVDSVNVDGADTARVALREDLTKHVKAWTFVTGPPAASVVVNRLRLTNERSPGFLKKHRAAIPWAVGILAALGFLLL